MTYLLAIIAVWLWGCMVWLDGDTVDPIRMIFVLLFVPFIALAFVILKVAEIVSGKKTEVYLS